MKITVYYEDNRNRATIEVPDEDCEIWVEQDYQRRLEEAEDKSSVRRRTAQEIMDEDYNRPTYNVSHAESRRHVSLDALDPEGEKIAGDGDPVSELIRNAEIEALHRAIDKLEPQQKELLLQIFWEGKSQREIAIRDGVSDMAITNRMKKIIAALKKSLT